MPSWRDLVSVVAVQTIFRSSDTMAALEILGVIEGHEQLEAPAEAEPPQIPRQPARPIAPSEAAGEPSRSRGTCNAVRCG